MIDSARIPQEAIDKAEGRDIGAVALDLGARWPRDIVDDKGVACPGCGGVDRFSVNRQKNLFFCRMSGAGGGPIALVRHVKGVGFRAAVEHLTGKAELPKHAPPDDRREDRSDEFREKARRRAWAIWQAGRPPLTLVPAYLRHRGVVPPDWRVAALREIAELAYWHRNGAGEEFRIVHRGPAMLAAIISADGRFMGVHRTWIDLARPNGKATIVDPDTGEILNSKKVEGSQRGGAIVLRKGGEGRPGEDGPPALWCAVNKDNLAGKAAESVPHPSRTIVDSLGRTRRAKVAGPVPDLTDLRCLPVPAGDFAAAILLGDGDSDAFETSAAMLRAARRFAAAGLPATIDWARPGMDFADALKMGEAIAVAPAGARDVVIGEGIETTLAWDRLRSIGMNGDDHDRGNGAGRDLSLHGQMLARAPCPA